MTMRSGSENARLRLIEDNEIPPLPAGWDVQRFRFLFRESKERNGEAPVGNMLSVSEYRGVVPKEYEHEEQQRADEELQTYRVVRPGQMAVNTMWLNHLGLGVSDYLGHVSPAYAVYHICPELNKRFVHHLFRSQYYLKIYLRYLYGIRPNSFQIKSDDWNSIPVIVPPSDTQKAIADFLDRETARVDQLIEKKQRLVGLLGEKFKAEKKRLVFDLDNQSVERSASTVSWFPSLPCHWRFMRNAHIFKNLDSRRIPLSAEQRGDLAKVYPYYGASGIIDAVDDYLFDEDTILVGEDGANLVMQSTPIAFKASGKYWVNNHAHILTPRFGDFDYWIHALNEVPYEVFVTGSAQPKLTSAALGNIRLPVPPTEEQKEIAKKIEARGMRVNVAIKPLRNSIDRLKEFRSALITAAVTGQIDVATWGKQGQSDRRLDQIEKAMQA